MRDLPDHSKLALAGLAWAVVYLVLAPKSLWLADALYQLPVLVALAVMLRIAVAKHVANRRFWVLLAPGVALGCVGDTLWMALELLGAEPTPSPADAAYLAGAVLTLAAMLRGSRAWSALRSLRALLDASVVTVAVVTIGFAVLIAPQAAGELDATLALALAYNALSVAALVPALFLMLGSRRAVPLPIVLVATGLLSTALGDGIYTWLEATGSYRSGHPVDLLWTAQYLLCAAAATIALRGGTAARAPAGRDFGLGVVVAGIVALGGLWLLEGEPWIGVMLGGAVVVMFVRLLVTAREQRRIAAELGAVLEAHEHAAVTDRLTGLRNRAGTEALLRTQDGPLGVLVLELECGSLGFEERDATVRDAAARVRSVVGDGALLGRTGGSEFVLAVSDPSATRAVGERLRAAIAAEPFAAGSFGASVGAAWAPEHARRARRCWALRSGRATPRASWAATRSGRPASTLAGRCSRRWPTRSTSGAAATATAVRSRAGPRPWPSGSGSTPSHAR